MAILQKYSIINKDGDEYKLYKSAEGNWYDISEETLTEKMEKQMDNSAGLS